MTQPKFAPILPHDEVRDLYKLPVPPPWLPHRPADFDPAARPGGLRLGRGVAGPDQGYAMLLVERFAARLVLRPDEHEDDVLHGASLIAMRRASLFGRAPVAGDIELALVLFGFLSEGHDELVAARESVFKGVAHHYWRERELVDLVPEATLRMSLDTVRDRLSAAPAASLELAGLRGGTEREDG